MAGKGSVVQLGGKREIKVVVRVAAVTNRGLGKGVQRGIFRSNLFYRLNVIPSSLQLLRVQPRDICALTLHF